LHPLEVIVLAVYFNFFLLKLRGADVFPLLNYQLTVTLSEAYLNKNSVSTLKREDVVLCHVIGASKRGICNLFAEIAVLFLRLL
jgi:hypothetical protein